MPDLPENLDDVLQDAYRYACSLAGDDHIAEDILQEVCVSILRTEGSWERPYLFVAVRNRFIDMYRQHKRARSPRELQNNGRLKTLASEQDPAARLVYHDTNKKLDEALAALRPTEREVMFLAAVLGFTSQQIAEQTGRSRGTVTSLLQRSRYKLRQLLNKAECEAAP